MKEQDYNKAVKDILYYADRNNLYVKRIEKGKEIRHCFSKCQTTTEDYEDWDGKEPLVFNFQNEFETNAIELENLQSWEDVECNGICLVYLTDNTMSDCQDERNISIYNNLILGLTEYAKPEFVIPNTCNNNGVAFCVAYTIDAE